MISNPARRRRSFARLMATVVLPLALLLGAVSHSQAASLMGEAMPAVPNMPAAAEAPKARFVLVVDPTSGLSKMAARKAEELVWKPMESKGLSVVYVAHKADDAAAATFASKNGLTAPVVADPTGTIATSLGHRGTAELPRALMAGADGKVVYEVTGFGTARETEWVKAATDLIAGKTPMAAKTRPDPGQPWVGHSAPTVYVQHWITGNGVSTEGKWVLIEFWATWCGPCRQMLPELQKKHDKYKDRLVIQAISDEGPNVVRNFVYANNYTFPIGCDMKQRTSTAVGVRGIPHALLVDPQGIVRWQGHPGYFVQGEGAKYLAECLGVEHSD